MIVSETVLDSNDDPETGKYHRRDGYDNGIATYHKFVKTTPKPRATKNKSGELVGPPPPDDAADVVAAGAETDVALDVDILEGDVGFPMRR